jgi:hypothetical protein
MNRVNLSRKVINVRKTMDDSWLTTPQLLQHSSWVDMISIISTMEPIAQDTHFMKKFEHSKRQKHPTNLVQICKIFLIHLSC